ncbi:hypothetical protein STZ1_10790 [Bacillus subtilis]
MVLDKMIHIMKVTGMFAAAHFTGDISGLHPVLLSRYFKYH